MNLIKELKEQHKKNDIDFDKLKSHINDKKKVFLDNLNHMNSKLKGHTKVFESVQRLTDKLPELFDHLKNLVHNLSQKENNKPEADVSSEQEDSSDSNEEIVQHEQTVEEEVFGAKPDSDDDSNENSEESIETEETVNEEAVHDDDGQETREETKTEELKENVSENVSETAETLDNKLEEINEEPNLVNLDDGILDQLEQEQKDFEIRQNDQNEHINGLKYIDDGLIRNGNVRRNFADRFVKYLGSDEMKDAPKDVKDHLNEMHNLFNARQD